VFDVPAARENHALIRPAGLLDGVVLRESTEQVCRRVTRRVTGRLMKSSVRLLKAVLSKWPRRVPRWLAVY